MTYIKNLQVPYHQQDTDYYCGAASAQMVLASSKVGLGLFGQDDLYNDNHAHSLDETHLTPPVTWATAPDGLTWTLNNRAPQPFVEFALSSEDAISRKIAWTVEHYEVPPCPLVMGVMHWIVVHGIDVSKAPTSSSDISYSIHGFRIQDPWPPVPAWDPITRTIDPLLTPPPPHSNTDNCGIGGNRGTADQYIGYNTWKNTYMTGANYPQGQPGHWAGKFVAVCDPEPPATRRGLSIERVFKFNGERLIKREEAIQLIMELIENKVLPQDKLWLQAMHGVKATDAIIVQRLDRLDDYYYITPLTSNKRGATAAIALDARFGEFQQAIAYSIPEPNLLKFPSSKAILKKVVGKRFELEKFKGSLRFREGVTTVPELWFWKPCRESLSPFWPFKMVVSGGNVAYVRVDGQVFTTLHEDVYGI